MDKESYLNNPQKIIMVSPSKLKDGEIGAFIMKGKETAVKRYFKRNDTVILEFDDGIQPPMIFSEKDVEIVGKLTYIIKKV